MALIDVTPSPRRSRRRALAFVCAFISALVGSLTYVYTRPAEYRAVARLQIAPAAAVTQPSDAKGTPTVVTDAKSFLTEVQVLTSRPLLQDVVERLKNDGPVPDLGPDPVSAIQGMVHAQPIVGTQVVELSAEGRYQGLVAPLVNSVVDAYRRHVADVYKGTASSTYSDVSAEAGSLDKEVAARREAVNAFRTRYDIVSMEHKENDVLAEIEGLSQSYTDANDRLAKAQAHLQAMRNSIAAGKAVVRAKDDPTLADIEQRTSVLSEQWRELQRRFTPNYLSIDPDAKSIQARLEALKEQVATQRAASQRAALSEAEEEVLAAQTAVEQVRKNVANNQKQAQEFATHLNEYKALREDLDHLEEMHRAALDRLTKLQASEQERAPRVELLEAAAPSQEPWRPNYRRDALIAVAGSLVFGLFTAWFVDFLAGPSAPPSIVMQHTWAPGMLARDVASSPLSLHAPSVGQLSAPTPLPRQLDDSEISALVTATADDSRLAVVALLMGMSVEELVALRWDAIDLSGDVIRLGSEDARVIPLTEPLRGLLISRRDRGPQGTAMVLSDRQGAPLAVEELGRLVLYGAYDGALDRPDEVTPAALRYTFLSHLLRQGIRAADISAVAGRVNHNDMVVLMQRNSPSVRRPMDQIDRLLPALREIAGGGTA